MFRLLIVLCALSGATTVALADATLPTGLYQFRQGETVSFTMPATGTSIDLGGVIALADADVDCQHHAEQALCFGEVPLREIVSLRMRT